MGTGNNLSGAQHAPEGFIDHNDTELPICPHCGYELHLDEAYKNIVSNTEFGSIGDALRVDEPADFAVHCPSCKSCSRLRQPWPFTSRLQRRSK